MQIFRHLSDPAFQVTESVITLGNFDGIHLGHQALIKGAVADAKQLGRCSIVLTFEPHPLRVLAPERAPPHFGMPERDAASGNEARNRVRKASFQC